MTELAQQINQLCTTTFNASLEGLIALSSGNKDSMTAQLMLAKSTGKPMMQSFHEACSSPYPNVPYQKAFQRLTERPVTGYDLIVYRDTAQLVKLFDQHMPTISLSNFDLSKKSTERRIYVQLDRMHEAATTDAGYKYEQPPSHEEIQQEIERHKSSKRKQRKSAPQAAPENMEQAQHQALAEGVAQLCRFANAQPVVPGDDGLTAMLAQMDESTGGVTFLQLAEQGKAAEFATAPLWAQWKLPPYSEATSEGWEQFVVCCHRINMLARLRNTLPPNMLKHIESQASGLASQLEEGSVDMSNLDMHSMGQSVIGACSSEDMSHLTSNISSLLPTLNSLAKTMNDVPGAPSMNLAQQALSTAEQQHARAAEQSEE